MKALHNLAMRHILIVGLLALVALTASANDAEIIEGYLDQTTSIKAEFTQTVMDEYGMVAEEKQGTVVILKPGQFLWEYRGDYPQIIGSDGDKVWIHDVALKQVTVRPIDNAMALSPAAILSGTTKLTEVYDLQLVVEQEGVRWMRMTPKAESIDMDYQDIQLAFKNEQLVAMRLVDNFSNINDIQFFGIQTNVPVETAQFKIDVDDDVDIVGGF